MDYACRPADLAPYISRVNRLLAAKDAFPYKVQLRADLPSSGIHRPSPSLLDRGDRERGLQPRGGRLRRSDIWFFDRQPKTPDRQHLYSPPGSRRRTCLLPRSWKEQVQQFRSQRQVVIQEYQTSIAFRTIRFTVSAQSAVGISPDRSRARGDLRHSRSMQLPNICYLRTTLERRHCPAPGRGLRHRLQANALRDDLRDLIAQTDLRPRASTSQSGQSRDSLT